MKIAVEGCCHGELDKIYETITRLEKKNAMKVDLLLICGDFQSVRNFADLQAMAVPPKFQKLNTFYKYYSGEKTAPVLTIFIGGNHEASNYLQELPYGGWVAKNIYYMGYAGIVQVGGIRIGGVSGIYKGRDFNKGHYERPPYDEQSKRSVYHVRNLEVFRLKQISRHLDIFVSHDWPEGVYHHGNVAQLIRCKPFFKEEISNNSLGSKPCADLLKHLKPTYWFAAHLHVKFAAHVQHEPSSDGDVKTTKFLALDKCLPRRRFLQVLDIPHREEEGLKIKLDAEWLTILQSTNHLWHLSPYNRVMPGPNGNERYDFKATNSDLRETEDLFGNDLTLPENFKQTAEPFRGNPHNRRREPAKALSILVNPQTTLLSTMLSLTDPNAKLLGIAPQLLVEDNCSDSPSSERGGADTDTLMDETPSFIDSSLDVSFQNSSNNNSFSPTGLLSKIGRSASYATDTLEVDDEELRSILSVQKTLAARISSASSSSPSVDTSSASSGQDRKRGETSRQQSIAERLQSLKSTLSTDSASSHVDSQDCSQSGSESSSRLTKSDTVECFESEDTDELQAILARQNSVKKTLSSSQTTVPAINVDETEDNGNVCVTKKRDSSEFDQTSDITHQESPKISSNKKMKRRNVSMYEEEQQE